MNVFPERLLEHPIIQLIFDPVKIYNVLLVDSFLLLELRRDGELGSVHDCCPIHDSQFVWRRFDGIHLIGTVRLLIFYWSGVFGGRN